jgi:hypothetical protein
MPRVRASLTGVVQDVFISYSTQDKLTADATCAILESQGIRCWIAPRDIPLGADWTESIIAAIETVPLMVLVFSKHANDSIQIKREVNLAIDSGVTVIPVRVEDVAPSKSLKYSISLNHWLDAFPAPLDNHLQKLTESIRGYLESSTKRSVPANPVDSAQLGADPSTNLPSALAQPSVPPQSEIAAKTPPKLESLPPVPVKSSTVSTLPMETPVKMPVLAPSKRATQESKPAVAVVDPDPRRPRHIAVRILLGCVWTVAICLLVECLFIATIGLPTLGLMAGLLAGIVFSALGKLPGTGKYIGPKKDPRANR